LIILSAVLLLGGQLFARFRQGANP